MDVPCSCLCSCLPLLPSCLCSHHASALCNPYLFVADPISRFWSILRFSGRLRSCRLTDWQIDKLAWMPVLSPLQCPTHPIARITHRPTLPGAKLSCASLSLRLQTCLHVRTLMHTLKCTHKHRQRQRQRHTHTHTHTRLQLLQDTIYSLVWWETDEAHLLSHWFPTTG